MKDLVPLQFLLTELYREVRYDEYASGLKGFVISGKNCIDDRISQIGFS